MTTLQVPPPSAANGKVDWPSRTVEDALTLTASSPAGLSSEEAAHRLAAQGRNEIAPPRGPRPLRIFFAQFRSSLVALLVVAAVIAASMGDRVDCVAILAILVLNAAIGFHQESRAERAIAALKSLFAPKARVWRDGAAQPIPAAEVVVGDVLALAAGDIVPADALLLEARNVRCVEASLTGESEPAEKRVGPSQEDGASMVFMGTSLASGSARAVVVATGLETQMGRIATLLAEPDEATPLQQQLGQFGRLLVGFSIGAVVLLFALGMLRGEPRAALLLTAISLAVAAVPEGLPAIVSIALALGVRRMARRGTLIRQLPAVETLGCTTVICTDKTGTLTTGQMTVRELYLDGERLTVTGEGYAPEGQVWREGEPVTGPQLTRLRDYAAAMTSCVDARLVREDDGAWSAAGDPTECALVTLAAKVRAGPGTCTSSQRPLCDFEFDAERRSRVVVWRWHETGARVVANGAPELLLRRCSHFATPEGVRPLDNLEREKIARAGEAMAGRGLRVLATAVRELPQPPAEGTSVDELERDLAFLGLAGMQDPPRAEARTAIAACLQAGIRPVMITGDHPQTALAIGREVGLCGAGDRVLTGRELESLSVPEVEALVPQVSVYARVSAENKQRLVKAWKKAGAVVAMTGDGVNDAPAIKGADIGIAMGKNGTEVTCAAADMVITDDNFATIVAAVEEGRGVYANIRKTLLYLLSSNAGELLLMTACIAVGLPLPLLPVQFLWINLVTDSLPALSLAADPVDPSVMTRKPRSRRERLAGREFLTAVSFAGLLVAGSAFGAFIFALQDRPLAEARTVAFDVLVMAQLFLALGLRSRDRACWSGAGSWAHLRLSGIVLGSVVVQVLGHVFAPMRQVLHLTPISATEWLWIIALALVPLAGCELVKAWRRRNR